MPDRFRDAFPILEVSDVARSFAFYRDRLGFEEEYRFPEDGSPEFVALKLGEREVGLTAADGPVQSGSVGIWLYTDDVDAAFAELRDAGAPVIAEPEDQPFGERLASIADPDGYTIHIGAPGSGQA